MSLVPQELLPLCNVCQEASVNDLQRALDVATTQADDLLRSVHPTIVWQPFTNSQHSRLVNALQPTGILNRVSWIITHKASGEENDTGIRADLMQTLCCMWVIKSHLIDLGGERQYAAGSAEALAESTDWLNRTISRTISTAWINERILDCMNSVITNDDLWRDEVFPEFSREEFLGLQDWAFQNYWQPYPKSLRRGEPGYKLGRALATDAERLPSRIVDLFDVRDFLDYPIALHKDTLIPANVLGLVTRLYPALLTYAEGRHQIAEKATRKVDRGRGALFEGACQRLIESYWGDGLMVESQRLSR